jgi:DNA-binding FadR family transcriptional regulator
MDSKPNTEERLAQLMRCICQTREEEIDSATWDLQFERVAEMAANGVDISTVLPAIEQYLTNSPDCAEEFRALVTMMRANSEHDLEAQDE